MQQFNTPPPHPSQTAPARPLLHPNKRNKENHKQKERKKQNGVGTKKKKRSSRHGHARSTSSSNNSSMDSSNSVSPISTNVVDIYDSVIINDPYLSELSSSLWLSHMAHSFPFYCFFSAPAPKPTYFYSSSRFAGGPKKHR